MKTIITIEFYHSYPNTIEKIKEHFVKLIKEWFNTNEVYIRYENK